MGIAVIGAVFVDLKGHPSGKYIPGGRNAGWVTEVHGGVSRNIAEDIAHLGLRPVFVSLVDESGIGTDVIERLSASQVNTAYMRRVPDGLGTWLAVFDDTGDVVAAISKRPDLSEILTVLSEKGDEIIQACDSVVIEIDIDPEIVRKTFELAEKYGKRVYAAVANMTLAAERYEYIRKTDCFVCNRQEAGILFSENTEEMEIDELQAFLLRRVREEGLRQAVVTLGGDGAVFASSEGVSGYVPAEKVHVTDTTGAGDAFLAGTVAGLTYGKDLRESCVIGTKLAASVIVTTENVCPCMPAAEFDLIVS